jgi:hypothetical protein
MPSMVITSLYSGHFSSSCAGADYVVFRRTDRRRRRRYRSRFLFREAHTRGNSNVSFSRSQMTGRGTPFNVNSASLPLKTLSTVVNFAFVAHRVALICRIHYKQRPKQIQSYFRTLLSKKTGKYRTLFNQRRTTGAPGLRCAHCLKTCLSGHFMEK